MIPTQIAHPINPGLLFQIKRGIKGSTFILCLQKMANAVIRPKIYQALIGKSSSRKVNAIGDFVSSVGKYGRTSKQNTYIDTLLQTKIVVVAQRDSWEDHYRLFESIVGGALVMTDPMISLPEHYVNGTNIIVYNSLENLRSLILYYLEHDQERIEIARNGWELALNYHRSYHWMERLFFGRKLTD